MRNNFFEMLCLVNEIPLRVLENVCVKCVFVSPSNISALQITLCKKGFGFLFSPFFICKFVGQFVLLFISCYLVSFRFVDWQILHFGFHEIWIVHIDFLFASIAYKCSNSICSFQFFFGDFCVIFLFIHLFQN